MPTAYNLPLEWGVPAPANQSQVLQYGLKVVDSSLCVTPSRLPSPLLACPRFGRLTRTALHRYVAVTAVHWSRRDVFGK